MTSDQRMINVIVEYIDNLPEPTSSWPPGYFREASYEKTAANEILATVLAHPEWTVIRSVEEFKDMVSNFSLKATHYEEVTYMFEVAMEVASNISDILMAMT